MAQLKPEDAETKGNHARMSSLNIKLSYSVTSEADEKDENPFDGMIEDVNKMISNVEAIHKTGQSNFNKTVNLVNSTFDKIQAIVDQERKEILKRISLREVKKHGQLEINLKAFKNLLGSLKEYSSKVDQTGVKEETQCQRRCKALIYDTLNNDSSFELAANTESLRTSLRELVKVNELNNNALNYEICGFDTKCCQLSRNSKFDEFNEYIKIGKNSGHCYANVKCGIRNKQGYNEGEHCWRLYYRNSARRYDRWLFFGLNEFGVKSEDKHSYQMENAWGIAGYSHHRTYRGGEQKNDKRISFIYEDKINMIDMLVDFDKGIISYTIVYDDDDNDDDDDDSRKIYKLTGLNKNNNDGDDDENKDDGDNDDDKKNVGYCVHFNLYNPHTEIQVAKIDTRMFGKNSDLVQWPRKYQE